MRYQNTTKESVSILVYIACRYLFSFALNSFRLAAVDSKTSSRVRDQKGVYMQHSKMAAQNGVPNRSKQRPFWSPWRVEKKFGDWNFCKGRQFGDFCSGGKELRCSLSYLIVNTDKMEFDHVNTVFVSISFRHTFPQFTCSCCVKSWTDAYASQFDLDVRAAIRENENVPKKIDLEIFRLQGTKSSFLQP